LKEKTDDPKSIEFYSCVEIVLNALINWAKLHALKLRELAQNEVDIERKRELLEMAQICESVPENPATTFREALETSSTMGFPNAR
jgi:formate C-acetyltransferase